MQYKLSQQITATISGSLSFADTSEWNKMIDSMLEYESFEFMLDMSELTSIDSSGIGLMIVLRDRMEAADGSLTVVKPRDKNVVSILKLVNLQALFPLVDAPP